MKGRKGHNTTVDPQDETINEKDNEKGEERHPHDEFYIDYGGEG